MCIKECVCRDCVWNAEYCINTPHPCENADCDICNNGDAYTWFCNQHLTIEEVDAIIEKNKRNTER